MKQTTSLRVTAVINILKDLKKEYGEFEVLVSSDPEGNSFGTLDKSYSVGVDEEAHRRDEHHLRLQQHDAESALAPGDAHAADLGGGGEPLLEVLLGAVGLGGVEDADARGIREA